ncbi:MAG: glycosyltransferase family 4 protein [Gaiellaceae bacterium]
MRVGYHSPLPPERTGVADYSALLLPALERHIEVVVVEPSWRLRRRPSFDLALYHVGNSPKAHGWILEALWARPGLVVLHDFVLHHLVAGVTLARGDGPGYLDAMQREAGVVGRLLAHGVIDGLVPPLWERRPQDFPLAREALAYADALIVHSCYVEERAREAGYGGRIFRIPHPAWPVPEIPPAALPRPGRPVIGCLGNLTPSKRVPQLFEAFARLRAGFPEAQLVVAGGVSGVGLDRELERFGVAAAVSVLGYVEEEELWSLLAASDVCVSLRWPTMGETSGIAIRALAAGRPLVVSDVGWFAELPDDAVAKIPVGDGEVDALVAALLRLAGDPAERARLGRAARELMRSEHDVDTVAEAYAAACEEAAGLPQVESGVLRQIAVAGAEVGMPPDSPAVRDIGATARELLRRGD